MITAGLDALPTGIAIWDADSRLRYANRAFRHSANIPASIEVGVVFHDFMKSIARSGEWILPLATDEWIGSEEADFGIEKASEFRHADGRIVSLVQHPLQDGGMILLLSDITAAKQNEDALREAKNLAEAMDEGKSRFLRAANHDLRQPLATLKILIYNCMQERDEEHRADMLHAMDIATSIMEDLLGALLQIGQLDAGRIQPRVTTFQLSQLFERLNIQFGHRANEKGLRLKFVGTRSAVATDRALLERILSNLVSNAIRYTEVGGIIVGCRREARGLRIEVVDTGRGVKPEEQTRIFEEFYRSADVSRGQKGGLGLGLNIVRRLADILEHRISLRSVQGKGSIFSVTVPHGNIWHSDIGEIEISEAIGGEFSGIPILLIEDDDILRRTMTQLMERWGIEVHAVSSESAALRKVKDEGLSPRLIVSDYSLKTSNGADVVAAVRHAAGRNVPAIIITADTEPRVGDHVKAENLPLLIKPVSPPRLRVLMHNLLFEPGIAVTPSSPPKPKSLT